MELSIIVTASSFISKRTDELGKSLKTLTRERLDSPTLREGQVVSSRYTIPFLRNRRFVGRSAILEELEQSLLVGQEHQRMAIVGLGGIGKTQVALEFAYRVKESRPEYSILWIPALSMESVEQAYREIERTWDISRAKDEKEDVKELVRRRLTNKDAGKWLLVVDNADDMDLLFGTEDSHGIMDYLPQSENGLVLFTTRHQNAAVSLADGNVIELDQMDEKEAVSFLEKTLIREELLNNKTSMVELLDELSYLPLAIVQAAAYLNINKNTVISDYLLLLRSSDQDMVSLLSQEFRDSTRYKSSANAVAKTWLISFDQISNRDILAADLLAFISSIEWKEIPRLILPSVQPEERMVRALGTLCAYSFITKRENEEIYDMHRLVHLAIGIWVKKQRNVEEIVKKAIQHVSEVFPYPAYENQAIWRTYLTHVLRLLGRPMEEDVEERYTLCLKVGQCLYEEGRIRESVKWFEESCRWRDKNLLEEDPDRLASQHQLAMAYQADGQIKKAVELMEHVVTVRDRILAEEHSDRLASQYVLAIAYQADGQIKKAVELMEHVVIVQAQMLVEEHPDRLASQHVLAIAYQGDGQIKKAVELMEHVVAVRDRILVEEHPSRLASQHVLAMAYEADGQIKKAVELMEHVVAVEARILVEEHPSRLASQHVLAIAYQGDGQIKKAVELMEHVVAVRDRILAEEHPSRLASQHVLAMAYEADGQIKKAVELMEHVVAVEARILVEEHPSRLASQHVLAMAYQADGQIKKAVELMEHVVAVHTQTLAEEHPSRLASESWLNYFHTELFSTHF
jgi:tetratricopeptide (TPR) repeat protein